MQYAIGIDPGGITGMALVGCDEDGIFTLAGWAQIDSRELGEEEAAYQVAQQVVEWRDEYPVNVLGMEDFVLRARVTDRSLLSPVRLIAKIETHLRVFYMYRGVEAPPIKFQSAANAKTIATDTRLKHWDLWVKGKQHARDAIRHACVALRGL